jgi:hypothetical protein
MTIAIATGNLLRLWLLDNYCTGYGQCPIHIRSGLSGRHTIK